MSEYHSESVEVLAIFRAGSIQPVAFKRANRRYDVKKVNLVHAERRGREKIFYFSVSDEANTYRLSLSSETMQWKLEDTMIL